MMIAYSTLATVHPYLPASNKTADQAWNKLLLGITIITEHGKPAPLIATAQIALDWTYLDSRLDYASR
jgi:hypothetical protein